MQVMQRPWRRCCALMLMGVALVAAGKAWEAPKRDAEKANPVRADEKSVAAGKKLYARECQECHGASGRGDGAGAKDLADRPPDLRAADVQKQSDGALFWKLGKGRGEMPSYRKMLSEEERWEVVNYVRTLKQKQGTGG
jgi:mono/diheme cytochrome c family protein